jgi:nucleoside-diphosphate-sugar epimerase
MTRPTTGERYLVTGALGCIGAWTVRALVREGATVVAFDLGSNRRRVDQIMTPDELAEVTFVAGDITDLAAIEATLDDHEITSVIHLAALQVPFCRADPPRGALVNVVGTVNVFEAVKRRIDRLGPLVYTSSMGTYSAADTDEATGRLLEGAEPHPTTHYGVYKVANEGTARIYALEGGVRSIGVRPMTVYGVGRDQGMTSSPTVAIAAAVLGVPFTITFSGQTVFQYAADVAATLVAASRSSLDGAHVFNLAGQPVDIGDWVATVESIVPEAVGLLRVAPVELPFPSEIDHAALAELGDIPETPVRDGIAETVEIFQRLAEEGRLVGTDQGLPAST